MTAARVAVIGTGADPATQIDGVSWSMAYRHAVGYQSHDDCQLVACADLERDRAAAFADQFDIPNSGVYTDYHEMIEETSPDIVSVCVATTVHAPIVIDCIRAGVPAIHCEKPMAATWGESRLMALEAWRQHVQLTFNHQHRFHPTWREAKHLLDEGAIGAPERIELRANNLFDHGTHLIDLGNFLTGDRPPSWVLGQIDCRDAIVHWGVHMDSQGLSLWQYPDGPVALASTGAGRSLVSAEVIVDGTDGRLEIEPDDGPKLRLRTDGGWRTIDPDHLEARYGHIHRTVRHVVDAYRTGADSTVSAKNALNATELIFGTYESVRRRARVDLPLRITDNPLESLIDAGDIKPESGTEPAVPPNS